VHVHPRVLFMIIWLFPSTPSLASAMRVSPLLVEPSPPMGTGSQAATPSDKTLNRKIFFIGLSGSVKPNSLCMFSEHANTTRLCPNLAHWRGYLPAPHVHLRLSLPYLLGALCGPRAGGPAPFVPRSAQAGLCGPKSALQR